LPFESLDFDQLFRSATSAAYRQDVTGGARHESFWRYIEAHHKDFGAALFMVPVLVVVLVVVLGFCAASALLVR
jgi:hypothetical protein